MYKKVTTEEKVNILLVDDTPSNLLALEVILEDPGYNLVGVTSGREALRYLADHDVAMILADVMMPIMDGFTLVKIIKEDDRLKEVPVIFLTAMAREGSQIFQGYSHGAVDYIQKPLNEDIVRAKVAVFAQLFRSRELLRRQTLDIAASHHITSLQLKITTIMGSAMSIEGAAEQLLEALGDGCNADVCELWTRTEERAPFQCAAGWQRVSNDGLLREPWLPGSMDENNLQSDHSLSERAWTTGEVQFGDGSEPNADGSRQERVRSVAFPAVANGRVYGVIRLLYAQPQVLEQRILHFFRDLCFRIGMFMQRMWAEAALHDLNTTLEQRVRKRTEEVTEANVELRRSSERFRILSEAIPQIVWTATPDGHIDYCNNAWFVFTGLSYVGGAPLIEWWTPVHEEDIEHTRAKWKRAVALGEPLEIEHRFKRNDGAYRWHLTRAVPQKDAEGRPEKWFGTSTDIEETKASEQRYAELYEAAEKMNRMRDEFLAMLSHELRTPLNIIMGYSDLLENEAHGSDEYEEALRAIQRNARVQNNLINELLDVSRIITGKLVLNGETVDMTSVVATTVESLKLAAQAKGITVYTKLSPSAQRILGDVSRLQQVLWNLFSNAIKFTPRDGIVTVSLGEAGPNLMVEVADSGEGIEPQFLPYVFERFKQEDSSSTRQHGGLGLGLAIVRHIVELHGGTVEVESSGKGHGATFRILLPYLTPSLAQKDVPESSKLLQSYSKRTLSPPPQQDGLLRGQQVLVVDDQPDARNLVARVLERAGAKVFVAESSVEAMGFLRSETCGLLICDIGMPGEDGYTFIGHVRAIEGRLGQIPAIALTAYASASDRIRVEEAGFQLHLAKPVTPKALIDAVTRFVH